MNQRIISEWFSAYSDDIYHFLIYMMGSTDVEDVVQDVFIRAIKGMDRFAGKASPKTWLLSIARHTAIDEIRRRKRMAWVRTLSFQTIPEPSHSNTPESIFFTHEENRDLFAAIQRLHQSYRAVIILRGVKQLSVAETAAVLNWSENKVRSTYYRARKALLKELGGSTNHAEQRV